MSGALTQEAGAVAVKSHAGVQKAGISIAGAISGAADLTCANVDVDGFVDGKGGLKVNGTAIVSSAKALANVTTISGSGFGSALGGIQLDTNGKVGTASDTDLLTLANNQLTIAGVMSSSTDIKGRSLVLDVGKSIGISTDTDLLTLTANQLTVAGALSGSGLLSYPQLRVDTNGKIGTVSDTDLLTLANNQLTIAGVVSSSTDIKGRSLVLDVGKTIGISTDTDLLTLTADTLTVAGAYAGGAISGSGALSIGGLSRFKGNVVPDGDDAFDLGTSTLQWKDLYIDGIAYIDDLRADTANIDGGNIDGTTIGASSPAAVTASVLQVDGAVQLDGVSDAAITLASDSLFFYDGDGLMKRDTFADYATGIAGDGLGASNGVLAVQVGTNKGLALTSDALEITGSAVAAAVVAVATDSFMFFDADGSVKEESFSDYAALIAGAGLTATNGVLSTDGGAVAAWTDGLALSEGYNYATGSAGGTCALPASPTVGDVVTIKAANLGASKAIIINRQGSHTIDGATSVRIESPYGAISFVYVVANDWRIV